MNRIENAIGLQRRLREPGLSLLVLLLCVLCFVISPLQGDGLLGLRMTNIVSGVTLWIGCAVVVRTRGAAAVLAAFVIAGAALLIAHEIDPRPPTRAAEAGARVALLVLLTITIGSAVFAAGRITIHRVFGAIAIYILFAMIFALIYSFIAQLDPHAFNYEPRMPDGMLGAQSLYFSLTTLTTAGFGDIVPVNPFARSVANFEAVIGQLYPATIIARLLTLEFEHRRRN